MNSLTNNNVSKGKTGRWEVRKTDHGLELYCSVCGAVYKTGVEHHNFCGNCGAPMEGFYQNMNNLK